MAEAFLQHLSSLTSTDQFYPLFQQLLRNDLNIVLWKNGDITLGKKKEGTDFVREGRGVLLSQIIAIYIYIFFFYHSYRSPASDLIRKVMNSNESISTESHLLFVVMVVRILRIQFNR